MTLIQLVTLLKTTGYPVAFNHFEGTSQSPAPSPPFITYQTPSDPNFKADNKVYHKLIDVDINLHTNKKDLDAEAAIENILNSNDIPYDAFQVYIESERLHQKTYEVRLI